MLGLIFVIAACATVDKDQLSKVRRVAIVGFEGRIEEGGGQLNEFAQALDDQQFGPKLYQIMQKQLKAAMGWDLVAREKIVAAAKVRGIAESKAGKAMAALDYKNKKILIPGIAGTAMAAALIKKHGRALARELGADALMTLSFVVSDESGSKAVSETLLGAIKRNAAQVHLLQCNLSLTLQNPRDASKIWYEPGITARSSDTPAAKYYGIPVRNLKQRAVISAFSKALAEHIRSVK